MTRGASSSSSHEVFWLHLLIGAVFDGFGLTFVNSLSGIVLAQMFVAAP